MKKLLLLLMLVPNLAWAGTITLTIQTAGGTFTNAFVISDANIARFLAAYKSTSCGPIPSGLADPITGVVPTRARTNTEVAACWASAIIAGTIANVQATERATTTQAIVDAPIPATPQ